ncbi:MAG: hypothetical protein ACXVB1_04780 [Pseudobdellovibrionaceae bacterium]
MEKRFLISILFLLFSAAPAFVQAATYYVRIGAIGSNSGTDWNNAWSNMSSIDFNVINPGDTIYIAAGTYDALAIIKSGTAGNPITFKRATNLEHGTSTGWSSTYDARIIIDGGGAIAAIGVGEGGSYTAQSYITVDGVTKYGIWLRNGYHGVRLDREPSSNNITLRYLEIGDPGIYKNGEDGIQGKGDNLVLENCYIHDNDSLTSHGDGIQWTLGTNITIRYNVLKNNGQMFMMASTAWGPAYVNDMNVYYNVFYNRGGSHYNGLVTMLCPQPGYSWRIYNNTFDLEATDNSGYNNIFNTAAGPCSNIDFKNNAIQYSNAGSVGNVNHSYNGYDNSGTYADYNIPSETGTLPAADLGFVNVSAGDYHLTSISPLISKGTNVGLTRDFDGNAVPNTPSIGAFEYGGSALSPTPLLAAPKNLRITP